MTEAEMEKLCRRIRENDPTLTKVSLRPITCSGNGCLAIFAALRGNTTVKSLTWYLRGTEYTPDAANCAAFADMLSRNKHIRELYLFGFHGHYEEYNHLITFLADRCHQIRLRKLTFYDYGGETESRNFRMSELLRFLKKPSNEVQAFQIRGQVYSAQLFKEILSAPVKSVEFINPYILDIENLIVALNATRYSPVKELSVFVECETMLTRLLGALEPLNIELHLRINDFDLDPRPLLRRLPSLHNVHKLTVRLERSSFLGSVFEAVQSHGNISCLSIEWFVDDEDQAQSSVAAFTPHSFLGLEDVELEVTIDRQGELPEETRGEISDALASAVFLSLRGNQSIQKLAMDETFFESTDRFRELTTSVIPSMPSLEAVDFTVTRNIHMDDERAQLVLDVSRTSRKLREVNCSSWEHVTDARLVDRIHHYCELNRTRYPQLLAADTAIIPMALWPFVLANVRHASVVFMLLREKNDVLVHPGSGRANNKRK